jgi:transposase
MHYCGLDASLKSTHVYIEDAQGRQVDRAVVATTPEGIERALRRWAARGLKVAIEAGNQTAWIHDVLVDLGAKVHVVHPVKVKWIAESKRKTDRVDAQLLAHLLRIGGLPEPVHMPSWRSRELRALLVARRQLVQTRTKLINVVRGLLRQQRVAVPPARWSAGGAGRACRPRGCRRRCARSWGPTPRRWQPPARPCARWSGSSGGGPGRIREWRGSRRFRAWAS